MIWLLRAFFVVVIVSMVAITGWAGLQQPLGEFARSPTFRDPWVLATLADAYWAFLTFFVWVAWKECSWTARALWFVGIVLLGNMAMSAYMLAELFAVSPREPAARALDQVFTRRNPGRVLLPGIMVVLAAIVYALA